MARCSTRRAATPSSNHLEQCDPPNDSACPGECLPNCLCPFVPPLVLHSVGPSVLNNATDFGVQLFGSGFMPGAQLQLSDKATSAVIETLPTTCISLDRDDGAGAGGHAGAVRHPARARRPRHQPRQPQPVTSNPPDIGHCQTDTPHFRRSPAQRQADCPPSAGTCVIGDQRLTMFNDAGLPQPELGRGRAGSVRRLRRRHACARAPARARASAPAPARRSSTSRPQQRDELWVYNTGTGQFVDKGGAPGIQGIPVGDNPFHVEMLTAGGPPRAWVVNRFADAVSIIDPATDTEIDARHRRGARRARPAAHGDRDRVQPRRHARLSEQREPRRGAGARHLRRPPRRAGVRRRHRRRRQPARHGDEHRRHAALRRQHPERRHLGRRHRARAARPRTRSSRRSRARATRRHRRRPRRRLGAVRHRRPRAARHRLQRRRCSALFVTSIGPQTGPRPGVGQTGGAIINPTITVIDAASDARRRPRGVERHSIPTASSAPIPS